jgi:hypothetical protein
MPVKVADAPAAKERPVVMPAGSPAQGAPQRPVVMPATATAHQPQRPVVMPAASAPPVVMPASPAPSAPPVVMPARTPPAAHAARPRPARPPREADPGAAKPAKSRLNLVLMVVGGVALLGIGGYFAWPKGPEDGDISKPPDQRDLTVAPPEAQRPVFDGRKRVADLKTELGTASAGQLWSFVQKLDSEAKAWREKKAPDEAVQTLEQEKEVALEDLLKLDADHAGARAMRDEVKYQNELEPFFDASYLTESDRDLVRRNRLTVTTRAGENGGWISRKAYDTQVKPLVDRLGAAQAAAESMAASPFGRAAKALEADTINSLTKALGGTTAFRAFVHKPYVIFVEENKAWSPQTEAKGLFSPLKAIQDAFLKEYASLGLEPLEQPIPVVYFISDERYQEYKKQMGMTSKAQAHYEPATGRLALNRGVDHEVVIHEGTHQVFDKYTKSKLPHIRQAYWFQEGIAEWFGGSSRIQAKDGSWTYEIGRLQDGRLDYMRRVEEPKHFKLAELLTQTYDDRIKYEDQGAAGEERILLVYSQGWLLIYFLNHFNVDATGMVKIGEKGKYADGWNEYVKAELNGKSGKKVFMQVLKLDDAGLENMQKEYSAYFNFIMRKRNLGQVEEKQLVAWDKYVNKKGMKTGEKEDDLLVAPPRNK